MRRFLLSLVCAISIIDMGVCANTFRVHVSIKERPSSWMGVSIGYNSLVVNTNDAPFLSQSPASVGVNLNLLDANILKREKFLIVSGLGFEFNNFRLSGNNSIVCNDSGVVVGDYSYSDAGIDLKKSKLNTCYLVAPLFLEFNINSQLSYVNIGVVGSWLCGAHTKVKYDGARVKGRDLPIANLRYGYMAGLGSDNFGIYARYYPKSIFKSNMGPDAAQFSVGVHFSGKR